MIKFSNLGGFPLLESVSVTDDGTNTVISFTPHRFTFSNKFYGGFWVKITLEVTGTNPIYFSTVGIPNSNVPVYLNDGTLVTGTEMAGTGGQIYLLFYDRDTNKVTLIA